MAREMNDNLRKIEEGKVYDTSKAVFVVEMSNEYDQSDFNYRCERLYVTTIAKRFFIHWHGWTNHLTEGIRVLSNEEAKQWMEDHQFINTYEKYFGIEEG